jgi:hypothetical protein
MHTFNVKMGDDVKLCSKYFNHRDNAILAMIKYSENLKRWCDGEMTFQKNKHDLDGYIQSIDVFINGVATHLLQVNEIKTEDQL